jgi:hypothetical protein
VSFLNSPTPPQWSLLGKSRKRPFQACAPPFYRVPQWRVFEVIRAGL